MTELNRQQICAELGVSESTIRRMERDGLPFTPVGTRSKRYNLDECKAWLRANQPTLQSPLTAARAPRENWKLSREFTESCRKVKLRVMPSWDKD